MYWMAFLWPWFKVTTVALISKNWFLCTIKWEPLIGSLLLGNFIALVMFITLLDFGEVLLETVILANFLQKIWMCFFKVKHYFGHISGMVGPIDVKRKGSTWVGYWVYYVTLTFDLTHDLPLGCLKVKFQNSCISGIVGLIDVNWKGSKLIGYWADYMTLPFDLEFQGQSLK